MNTQPERYDVRETDNRDTNTTWLWLDGTSTPSYVEVDPIDLFVNMVDNLDPDDKDEVIERVLLQLGCMGNKD